MKPETRTPAGRSRRSAIRRDRLTVIKVGGSLLQGVADLRRVASALAERRRDGGSLLVVASALRGVTDLLELAAQQALDRQRSNGHFGETLETLRRRHLEVAREIAAGGSVLARVQGVLDEAEELIGLIGASGTLSDAAYARLLSYGERLSVVLLAAALQEAGHEALPVAAEEVELRATGAHRAGACDIPASAPGLQRMRRELADRILVLTGFYGIDRGGDVVLFGRGGSDDTACAVTAGLDAGRLELWKDVPGLMSADPRDVASARVIPEISFDEVAQLGAYGSRVVHHGCLDPLRGRATEVFVSGTRLVERLQPGAPRVVALTAQRGAPAALLGASLVGVALVGLVGEGVAGDPAIRTHLLSRLAAVGARSDLVARPSGRSGLSCTVHPDDLLPALSDLHASFFPSALETAAVRRSSPRRRP